MDKENSVLEVELIKLDNIIGNLSSNVTYSSEDVDFCISSFMENRRKLKVKLEQASLVPIKKENEKDLLLSDNHLNNNKYIYIKTEGKLMKEDIKEEFNDEISDMLKSDPFALTNSWNEAINIIENDNEIERIYIKEEPVLEEKIKVENEIIFYEYKYKDLKDDKQNIDIKENIIESSIVNSDATSTSVYEDGNKHTSSRNYFGRETVSTTDARTDFTCQENENTLYKGRHTRIFHSGIKNCECHKCRKTITLSEGVRRHISIKHQRKEYECNECKKTFATSSGLKKHTSGIHEGIKYKCEECKNCFTRLLILQAHIETVHCRIRKYECKKCNKIFVSANGLKKHTSSIHEGIKYKCVECNKTFSQLPNLQTHIEIVHNGIRKYECRNCDSTFTAASALKRHISSIHDGIKYKCAECNKNFSRLSSLQTHIETVHNKIRKYECKECNCRYTTASNLKRHTSSIHEGIKCKY